MGPLGMDVYECTGTDACAASGATERYPREARGVKKSRDPRMHVESTYVHL
jgi:hypothetical protein